MSEQYKPVDLLYVSLQFTAEKISVGRLAIRDKKIYFEYDNEFLVRGLAISPYKLPVRPGVQSFDNSLFGGLPGVFDDSLPDGWGRLILDRSLKAKGMNPELLSPLDRLAHVGNSGMGALVYEPIHSEPVRETGPIDLNVLATHASKLLKGEASKVLDELVAISGSSAGARPKVMIGVNKKKTEIIHGVHDLEENYEHWMVKFPNTTDGLDSGAVEYVYAQMAKDAGIDMEETYLFPAKNSPGYFGTKRFDRINNERIHLHTAAGLVHSDFRVPSLDYRDLLGLTIALTRDLSQAEEIFRLAVFNVLGHNRDDHGKNFSYLMNKDGHWHLSPAYDLIYSAGPGGEQSTIIMGEGRNPGVEDLMKLAEFSRIPKKKVAEIIDQCRSALANWKKLAKRANVDKERISEIEAVINRKV